MSFIRLSDNYIDHPKFLALSDGAFRLWHEGMAFCRKHQTDGVIPSPALQGFRYFKRAHVQELTTAYMPGANPLWNQTATGYQVHDYLDWNLSKAEEDDAKRGSAERTRRWRKRRAGAGDGDTSGAGIGDASRDARVLDRIGSDDVTEGVQGEPSRPADDHRQAERRQVPERRRLGVLEGGLPRDHVTHAECSPNFAWCVPAAVHGKLVTKLSPRFAGDRSKADAELRRWYPTVWAGLIDGFVMPDAFRFWEGRFDAEFATKETPANRTPQPVSNVPSAAATRRQYLEADR